LPPQKRTRMGASPAQQPSPRMGRDQCFRVGLGSGSLAVTREIAFAFFSSAALRCFSSAGDLNGLRAAFPSAGFLARARMNAPVRVWPTAALDGYETYDTALSFSSDDTAKKVGPNHDMIRLLTPPPEGKDRRIRIHSCFLFSSPFQPRGRTLSSRNHRS